MLEQDIAEIDITMDQCKENIELMECLDRLRKNKDWTKLIEKGYLEKEAARLVLAKAEPSLQAEEHQNSLDKMINGVGYFRQYLNKIYQIGYQSQRALPEHENTRNELMEEMH